MTGSAAFWRIFLPNPFRSSRSHRTGRRGHRTHHGCFGRHHHQGGTNHWHGDEAFYDRAASLNARFPIENPAPNPKQPFSRQNYVGTARRTHRERQGLVFFVLRICPRKCQHRVQSSQPDAIQRAVSTCLARLVNVNGTTVTSIPVPSSVAVPFRDYLGTARFDWAAVELARIGFFALPPIATSRTMRLFSKARFPLPAPRAQQLFEFCHWQSVRIQPGLGSPRSFSAAAFCT